MNPFETTRGLLLLAACAVLLDAEAAAETLEETELAAETVAETEPAAESAATDTGGKFLPLPIIITEPAIGEGLGAALVYFHGEPMQDAPSLSSPNSLNKVSRDQKPPPTATGVFGAYTNTDTWFAGLGHSRTFKEDRWRLIAGAGRAKVNTTFYFADLPFRFSLEGDVAMTKLKRRLANSNMFVGLSASYINAETTFFEELPLPVPGIDFRDVGVALSVIYDSRDDTMMPTSGQLFELESWHYNKDLGGSFNYWKPKLKANSFHSIGKRWVLGLRLEGSTIDGESPFYAAPYVSLRGIPALRYQGKSAGVFETEVRYQLAKRWSVLAFGGVGFTENKRPANKTGDDITAWGFGARWLALPAKNAWVGIDVARGPEEDAFYIQLAHPW